ncbi:MAG TPA: GC-type dockerin domain-anchored protein [Phycisphaerales bacterium]|nr:GC-type dockerin domain-anchored protein [Phycisphaerales bacterium]
MKNQAVALLALLATAGTATAAPRESQNAPPSVAVPFETSSADFSLNFTGSDGAGTYSATRIRFDGTMTAVADATYAFDTIVAVTPPGAGVPIAYRMSQLYAEYEIETIALNVSLGGTFAPAGSWSFSCTDDYDDSSADPLSGGVESTLDNLVITLDDQPVVAPAATALGTLVDGTLVTQEVALGAAEVRWFTFTCDNASVADLRTLDITTANSTMGGDSMLALYSNGGAFLSYNDDSGSLLSRMTFGHEGDWGDLAAGTYYLAVTSYFSEFMDTEWEVVSEGGGGTFQLDVLQSRPVNPEAVGAATVVGGSVLFEVTVTPAAVPPSTGITVTGNLVSIGGSATQAFYDDGSHGDASAGDGVYSYSASMPAGAADGSEYSVSFTASDAQGRSVAGDILFAADVGDLPESAYTPVGTGPLDSISGVFSNSDVDMYRINICDLASFSATTNGGTDADTQLFLFNLDGTGVVMNDDIPDGRAGDDTLQSEITGALLASGGEYYLAVSRFDRDPVDAGATAIWADTPYNAERAPDAGGGPVAAWEGENFGSASYTVTLTGVCHSTGGGGCGPADLGATGGVPGADSHLDNNDFVVFIDFFFAHNPLADQGSTGGVAGADGAYDNNDFVVFIDNFFVAPVSCR